MSVSAYVLIQTDAGKASIVAAEVGALDGVASADGITGPYDVIARADAETLDDLGRFVVSKIQLVSGVRRTLTCPIVELRSDSRVGPGPPDAPGAGCRPRWIRAQPRLPAAAGGAAGARAAGPLGARAAQRRAGLPGHRPRPAAPSHVRARRAPRPRLGPHGGCGAGRPRPALRGGRGGKASPRILGNGACGLMPAENLQETNL